MPDAAAIAVAKYNAQKAGHDHEWTLLAARIQAFLTSQSLFAAGASVLATQNNTNGIMLLAAISGLIAVGTSVAIAINCKVIRRWHVQMRDLIDHEYVHLQGYFMPRNQPDILHFISTDALSQGLCLLTGGAWIYIFGYYYWPGHEKYLLAGALALWGALIATLALAIKIRPRHRPTKDAEDAPPMLR